MRIGSVIVAKERQYVLQRYDTRSNVYDGIIRIFVFGVFLFGLLACSSSPNERVS